jgi:acetylornithine deacetylase
MKDVVEHLKHLVKIPSVSSLSNRPVIDYAREALHEAHWHTQVVAYKDAAGAEKINLIAAPPGQNLEDPASELAFVCHTDTVPYAPDWTKATAPFVADGFLYGCGSCDVKGFLACLLTAISQTAQPTLIHGLRIVLTADEEIGCIGMTHLLASGLIRTRRAIVGEPTSLQPARAGKGYCLAEVTVSGQEAHSALPHKGKSAIYPAARLVIAIEEFGLQLAEEQNQLFSPAYTSLNIGTIQGGTAKNIVPGQCTFQLEWRPIPGQPVDTVPGALSSIAEKLRETDPDFHMQFNVTRQQGGFETPADSKVVRSIEALAGQAVTSIPFASEASLLAGVAEEVVVFGPGDMQTAHSNRECVPLSELEKAVAIVKSLMTTG